MKIQILCNNARIITKTILPISLLLMGYNVVSDNASLLIHYSNMFLFSTILLSIYMEIFMFNFSMVVINNTTENQDSIGRSINMICLQLILGICCICINMIANNFNVYMIPCYVVLLTYQYDFIQGLVSINVENSSQHSLQAENSHNKLEEIIINTIPNEKQWN